jgi:hypothetical protein
MIFANPTNPSPRRRSARLASTAAIAAALLLAGLLTASISIASSGSDAGPGAPSGGLAPGPSTPAALQPPKGVTGGQDISWAQCPVAQGGLGNPMPGTDAGFAVVGLSGGQAFTGNPCLTEQVAHLHAQHLLAAGYVFTSYPTNPQFARYGGSGPYGTRTFQNRLRNVGWQQATYWSSALHASGLQGSMVWVDVETTQHGPQWSTRTADNLAVIKGLLAGLEHAGLRTGIYTTSAHWRQITGGVRLGRPEWRTVGQDTPAVALSVCAKPGWQGSPVVLAQYYTTGQTSTDYDLRCPAIRGSLINRYFTRQ